MFTATPTAQLNNAAGALSTDDVNIYQSVGALTVVSVVGASTLAMAVAAPVPVLGTVAVGGGLLYYGTKIANGDDTKSDKTADKKAEATTPEAPKEVATKPSAA